MKATSSLRGALLRSSSSDARRYPLLSAGRHRRSSQNTQVLLFAVAALLFFVSPAPVSAQNVTTVIFGGHGCFPNSVQAGTAGPDLFLVRVINVTFVETATPACSVSLRLFPWGSPDVCFADRVGDPQNCPSLAGVYVFSDDAPLTLQDVACTLGSGQVIPSGTYKPLGVRQSGTGCSAATFQNSSMALIPRGQNTGNGNLQLGAQYWLVSGSGGGGELSAETSTVWPLPSTTTSVVAATAAATASTTTASTATASATSTAATTTSAVTSTASRAVTTGTSTLAASMTGTTPVSITLTTTGPLPPPSVVTIDGFIRVDGPWTTSPNQVTIFTGNISAISAPARVIVNGPATLAGSAIVQLTEPMTDTHRVRLVLATSISGSFTDVEVRGPSGDCTKYSPKALSLPTLYAINVVATDSPCPTSTDRKFLIVGIVIGGVFALAVTIAGIIVWLENFRPDLLPHWVGRVRRLRAEDYEWR